MKALLLLAILASPAIAGSIAVTPWRAPSASSSRSSSRWSCGARRSNICMILMRRWQIFGRDLFLIEQNGRHRWVDAFELNLMPDRCRVRAQQFRPDFLQHRRRRE